MADYFVVLKKLKTASIEDLYSSLKTQHSSERLERFKAYGDLDLFTDAKVIDTFLIDKGHINGPEIHSITNTGLIIIFNEASGKLITILAARPGQIRRYYVSPFPFYVKQVIDIAYRNVTLYNANNI